MIPDPLARSAFLLWKSDRTVRSACQTLDKATEHIRRVRAHITDSKKQLEICRKHSMKTSEVKALRSEWQKLGSPACTHTNLSLEETNTGYLTGNYVCVRCGAEVFRKPQ